MHVNIPPVPSNVFQIMNKHCVKNRKSYTVPATTKKARAHVKNGCGKQLTVAVAVITHLGLDMRGNVSIDSHLMMDCVLK